MHAIGRTFFALAFIGLGLTHFLFRDFMTGRAPAWPEAIAGRTVWAFLSGAWIIIAGIAILAGRRARAAALSLAALILGWALLRHVPEVAGDSFLAPAWTRAGKALAFVGGALAVAGTSPAEPAGGRLGMLINRRAEFLLLGRICLGIFLLITGVQHFIYTEFVATLIPGWFPGDAVRWTWFAGVALLAGGAGLLVPRTARLAALLSGTMVFSWFWIVHLPRSLGAVTDRIAVFEALAVSGIAFVLAAAPKTRSR